MTATRREWHVIIISILLVLFQITAGRFVGDLECLSMLCIVFPLGLYIATDPERISKR